MTETFDECRSSDDGFVGAAPAGAVLPVAGASARRARLLFLAHRVPYPPNRGDRIRSFHELQYLAQRADVSCAFLCQEPPDSSVLEPLERLCEQVSFAQFDSLRWVRGLTSLVAGRTVTEGAFYSRALAKTLQRWAQRRPFDLTFVFCSSMAQYLSLPALEQTPAVVDLVDVDSQKWFDYARQSPLLKRWLYRWEGQRLRRLEAAVASRAAAVLLVNRRERELFQGFCPSENVYDMPNGVDVETFRPTADDASPAGATSEASCVFVGALDYDANIHGVSWFCDEVWPRVLGKRPDARFSIVGSRPKKAVLALARREGIDVVGEVDDVKPFLSKASVVVIPLLIARGLQNKVLEALAMGKPVITTPQVWAGTETRPGRDLCVESDAQAWANTLVALFEDPARRHALGASGRAHVVQEYAWSEKLSVLDRIPGLVPLLSPAGSFDGRETHGD